MTPTRGPQGDIALEHGVRFHLAPNSKLPPHSVMVLFEENTPEGHAGILLSMEQPWPANVPRFAACVIGRRADLDEAIAFVGFRLGHGVH